MDMDEYKQLIKNFFDEIFEKRPTKDVFEKCLIDLIIEKNKLIDEEKEENKKLIDDVDKIIENIQIYLSVASK